jgi:hypothetical protein
VKACRRCDLGVGSYGGGCYTDPRRSGTSRGRALGRPTGEGDSPVLERGEAADRRLEYRGAR